MFSTYTPDHRRIYDGQYCDKKVARVVWLACEAARDAEVEQVTAELKAVKPDSNIQNDYQEGANDGAIEARHDAVRRLRSLLTTPRKEGP